ncbi:MAG: hypothetical protein Q8L55_15890 [Phycisphaerales bacterium]|nr:hypothetical protein [Phycisphaerales bacterium]
MDRLWVWDPSDVDRLVAVYGDAPENGAPSNPLTRAWLAVTDLDGAPIALLDHSTGSVVTRQGFDAQGNVVGPSRSAVGWVGGLLAFDRRVSVELIAPLCHTAATRSSTRHSAQGWIRR